MDAVPNPFRGRVTIRLASAPQGRARGRIYDAAGREVRSFSVPVRASRADWTWDGKDSEGRRLSAGAYFVEVQAGDESQLTKVLLTR
jgi:flagellar hook assembly protein FlgD